MTPFAVAGIQMQLHHGSNIEAMRHRLDLTMQLYPWVQMVLFSELACFGPLLHHAQPLPGAAEEAFQDMAAKHRVWLVNGSMYERKDGAIGFRARSAQDLLFGDMTLLPGLLARYLP